MISAVNTGFYNKLISSTGLQTALGGSGSDKKIYAIKAPQSATVPYVTFGLETDVPMGTFQDQTAMESLTYWINVFSSTSVANVTTLTDLVLAIMDDASLTVAGYTGMKCVREFMGAIMWDMDTKIFQCPLRYRVWIDKDNN